MFFADCKIGSNIHLTSEEPEELGASGRKKARTSIKPLGDRLTRHFYTDNEGIAARPRLRSSLVILVFLALKQQCPIQLLCQSSLPFMSAHTKTNFQGGSTFTLTWVSHDFDQEPFREGDE